MTYYTYHYLLPEMVGTAVSNAVRRFAVERYLKSDVWYHGLPVWIVWGEEQNRVNKVQIDAVEVATAHLLSFLPDAYEDMVVARNDLTRVQRRTATPEAVTSARIDLDIGHLMYEARNYALSEDHIADQVEYIEGKVHDIIVRVWETAKQLALDYTKSWEYVTDLRRL